MSFVTLINKRKFTDDCCILTRVMFVIADGKWDRGVLRRLNSDKETKAICGVSTFSSLDNTNVANVTNDTWKSSKCK